MSDRIAVMSSGKVEQVAPPQEVYEAPATTFVADFLGVSNLMEADAKGKQADGTCKVMLGEFEMRAANGATDEVGSTRIVIRPERMRLEDHSSEGPNRIPGMIERPVYLGNAVQLMIRLASGDQVQALIQNAGEEIPYRQGDAVKVYMPAEALRVLTDTGTAAVDEDAVAAVAS